MPKLGKYHALLDTVFFLYRDQTHAVAGSDSGGTGFLVGLPSKRWPDTWHHLHGVTNWHVAVRDGFPCIRVNMSDGKPEAFDFDASEWLSAPGGPDLAISPPLK